MITGFHLKFNTISAGSASRVVKNKKTPVFVWNWNSTRTNPTHGLTGNLIGLKRSSGWKGSWYHVLNWGKWKTG
jgi:hypothetical protein